MLQSVNDLKGYNIIATNGEIGNIEEFYFDDEKLTVRYLVANTGSWLTGKQNLISPQVITHLDREQRNIHVKLTREQVENSPGINKHQPVSRQMERIVSDYYGNSTDYWDARPDLTAEQLTAANATAVMVKSATDKAAVSTVAVPATSPDVHLRSMQEIATYHIAAIDGEIGEVEDFFLETDDWSIRYIGVDTSNWLAGKHVLVSALWLGQINWSQRKVSVNLTRREIEKSPDYNRVTKISHEYETRLHKHYGDKTAGNV